MLVFTFATDDISDYAIKTELINKMYCAKQKYKWRSDNKERLNSDWDKQWEKVAMMLDVMRETKEGEWLCWIDADAAFNHHDVKLESFTRKAGDNEILVCHDGVNKGWKEGVQNPDVEYAKDPHYVNTGIMLIKNTPWTRSLVQRWIRTPGKFKKGSDNQDQDRFVEMFFDNEMGMEKKVKVFPANAFNSAYGFPDADTFVVHMMARSKEERAERFDQMLERMNSKINMKETPSNVVDTAFKSRMSGGNVAIVTMYDNKIASYAHLTSLINSMYAAKYGYEMITIRKRLSDRAPQWDKIYAVKEVLDKDKHEFVMWIDADAIFSDFNTNLLEKIIKPSMTDDTDLIICDDSCNKSKFVQDQFYPNTGTFVFRNTPWSKEFVKFWWENPEEKKNKRYHEQDKLKQWYEENQYGLQTKLKLLPSRTMNSCFQEIPNAKNLHVKKTDTFIIHLMATDNKIREKYFKTRYEALLNENPEYLTHYNDRTSMEMQKSDYKNGYEATIAIAAVVVVAVALVFLIIALRKKKRVVVIKKSK